MKDFVKHYLEKRGYEVNTEALGIIGMCDDWYRNKEITDFHNRSNLNGKEVHLSRMNFAKRGCSDDANLCEIVSVAPEKENDSQEFIEKFLSKNRFDVQYRKQLEKTSATGTTGAYIYLKNADYLTNGTVTNGEIRINYCDADSIIPLTIENDVVLECAFSATGKVKGKEKTTLVIFTLENNRYKAETVIFEKSGKIESENSLQLGEIKPFSIMTNAEVNNLDNMEGYGLPKIYNSIPVFKAFELLLSLLSMSFGYGTKKYTFENGKITTAKEYIGTKQDSMQELNKQRKKQESTCNKKTTQKKKWKNKRIIYVIIGRTD